MSNTGNTVNWQRRNRIRQNHFREVTKMRKQEGHPDEPECPSNEKIKTKIIITYKARNMKWQRERRSTS